jgi:hypothetical protein
MKVEVDTAELVVVVVVVVCVVVSVVTWVLAVSMLVVTVAVRTEEVSIGLCDKVSIRKYMP